MVPVELVRDVGTPRDYGYAPNGGIDREPNSFHMHFDPRTESATAAIVRAVALVHNTEQQELDPLASVLDPDALNQLLGQDTTDGTVEVTFSYEGLEVIVTNDGDIWLQWE